MAGGPASGGAHDHHSGTTVTGLIFGGRRVQVARPRVRSTKVQEAQLPALDRGLAAAGPRAARGLDQIRLGVSTPGGMPAALSGLGGVVSCGTSESAMNSTLRGQVTTALAAQVGYRLEGRKWLGLFPVSVVIEGQQIIVGLGLTSDGEEVPVGLPLGSTWNAVVCTELLPDLLERGLRKAVQDVLGPAAVIQRRRAAIGATGVARVSTRAASRS